MSPNSEKLLHRTGYYNVPDGNWPAFLPSTYFDAPGTNMVGHLLSLRPLERRAYSPGIQSAEPV
jgi:hypothetical protein